MTYIKNKLPVLGFLNKNNLSTQTLQNQNISNITFNDNSSSTDNDGLTNTKSLVFATFSRDDEQDSGTISILVGDSNDETRISRVIGDSGGSTSNQYKYQSSNEAIDFITPENGLNIRSHYTDNQTQQIDYGDGCFIFFIRSL